MSIKTSDCRDTKSRSCGGSGQTLIPNLTGHPNLMVESPCISRDEIIIMKSGTLARVGFNDIIKLEKPA
jgi:hypothetical protein